MKTLWEFLSQFWKSLRPWVIVQPWQQGVRVRLGRWRKTLGAGVHLKLPIADAVFVQSIRRRIAPLYTQTVTTKDGKTTSFTASVAYAITDVGKLYDTLHHAEDSIKHLAMAALARDIRSRTLNECNQLTIETVVARDLDLGQYGLSDARVYLLSFATVKTYRLINDSGSNGIYGDALDTVQEHAG